MKMYEIIFIIKNIIYNILTSGDQKYERERVQREL